MITVGLSEAGSEIRATANDTIVLRLPENPTTGVRWDFEGLEGPVRLTGDTYESSPGAGIGAAAVRILTLQPVGLGRVQLELKRWQKWEGASTIDARFKCSVEIEQAP